MRRKIIGGLLAGAVAITLVTAGIDKTLTNMGGGTAPGLYRVDNGFIVPPELGDPNPNPEKPEEIILWTKDSTYCNNL